jgi:exonuclease III
MPASVFERVETLRKQFAMKIAAWNVNSVRARLERLLAWLSKTRPDVVCLQELKVTDEAFPYEAIRPPRLTGRSGRAKSPRTTRQS